MKKKILRIVVPLLVLMLTGCKATVTKSDIKKYVSKTYGLKNFEVNAAPDIVTDSEGLKDEIWKVTAKDSREIEFEVLVNRASASIGTTKVLSSNYYDRLLAEVIDGYDADALTLSEVDYEGYRTAELVGHFSDGYGLQALFEAAMNLQKAFQKDGIKLDFRVLFCMDTPYRDRVDALTGSQGYLIGEGDYRTTVRADFSEAEAEQGYADALAGLVKVALYYGLEDSIAGIPAETLQQIFDKNCTKIGIIRDDSAGNAEYFEGMCANGRGNGISFGNLYKVLVNEGMMPEGNPEHYSFYGADGNTYEISYDFTADLDYRGQAHYGYYYLKNGEIVPMRYYFYNHFSPSEVETMTGLRLTW